jgi:NAD(P)H-flavin reductase
VKRKTAASDSDARTAGNPYVPYPVVIDRITVENEAADLRTFRLRFRDAEDRRRFAFQVGQFAELSLLGYGECPIGIASSPLQEDFVEFTVKRYPTGVVTTALHNSEVGQPMGVRGPLGNTYPVDRMRGRDVVIIGGGFAVTTLRATIQYLLHPSVRPTVRDITVVYGARTPGELCYKPEFLEWQRRPDIRVHLTVDKGTGDWKGREGVVPAVVKDVRPSPADAICLICGPPVMLKFTIPVLADLGFRPADTYLSFEMRMKCGIGKCGRCNIGDRYVCIHGPVFSLAEIRRLPEEY